MIDEIDKADIEFPNDLLQQLDRMEFYVYRGVLRLQTSETIKARRRPIVIITSNSEKELPDAFLRRCFFHYIRFPDSDTMRAITCSSGWRSWRDARGAEAAHVARRELRATPP
jgi:MoxR-like ATPase